jgi:sec-independent protein translocase protein TatB
MFNVGSGELLVILLVALLVLGPQRLPDAARQAGKVLADLRRMSSGFQAEIRQALEDADNDTSTSTRRNPLDAVETATVPEELPGDVADQIDAAMATAADHAAPVPTQPVEPAQETPPPAAFERAGDDDERAAS